MTLKKKLTKHFFKEPYNNVKNIIHNWDPNHQLNILILVVIFGAFFVHILGHCRIERWWIT
ncbi:hypothetical protein BpHYR1_044264 [Brachionus plicatilis]|uniref:Uncharacterized protein n=1 Tax=Brachionus plicatilis TaxID=10195 RepID=A0A3M7SV80_BRAPC|nr:hypothetical protein BpHYR1_044264 [Brachionus plicatilis]